MDITVRFAKYSDLEKINLLRRQVNDVHVSGRPDIFRPGFAPELRDHIFKRFGDEDYYVAAAFCGETLCGFASGYLYTKPLSPFNLERKVYQVEEFCVDNDYRRKGVATAMIDFLKKDAASKGYSRIELDVWAFNESAFEFYNAVGFVTYRKYMELNINGYPDTQTAERMLEEAEKLNPGPWGDHSRVAAMCARAIAERCGRLDPEKAYVLGLLHDIGRRFGVSCFKHIYDGFDFMNKLGYPDAAKVCLTHSFSVKNIADYIGKIDVTDEQRDYISAELEKCEYDDYDRLIQLCDAISMPGGAVPINVRMDDIESRYGRYPQEKRDKNMELLRYFSELAGEDVETITKGITITK